MPTHLILYVADQVTSTTFYRAVLSKEPRLDVPGMTEFSLEDRTVLGLMPEAAIRRLLGESLPDPSGARGVPRCEVYLVVPDPEEHHRRALAAGAVELSPLRARDWGDDVGYSLDPDGHVLAFARPKHLHELAAAETEFERLARQERDLRERVSEFSAGDRLTRDEVHARRH